MKDPWMDILLFSLVFICTIIFAALQYITKCSGICRHKWNDWFDDSTEDAYVQFRTCSKCGYTEREQWKKIKEKQTCSKQ